MALFDALSGTDEAEQAAAANAALYGSYGRDVNNLYQQYQTGAGTAIGGAREGALGALGTGLSDQLNAYNAALEATRGGTAEATAAGRAGVAGFDPLRGAVAGYDPAVSAYYGALGLQGPEGTAAARNMFSATPGYQFEQDEAARQAAANASRLGISGSGNTLQAISDRAGNIANTHYNDWLSRIGAFVPLQQQGLTAYGTGVAGANRTLADIYNTGAGREADIWGTTGAAYGTAGAQRAGVETGYGGDLANILGNVTAGQTQAQRDVTQGLAQGNLAQAQAGQQDAANLWGAIGAGVGALGSAFKPYASKAWG